MLTKKAFKKKHNVVISQMIFFLRNLAVSLLLSSFFIVMSAQAGIVEPVYKQLKDPGTDNAPSTVSLSIPILLKPILSNSKHFLSFRYLSFSASWER